MASNTGKIHWLLERCRQPQLLAQSILALYLAPGKVRDLALVVTGTARDLSLVVTGMARDLSLVEMGMARDLSLAVMGMARDLSLVVMGMARGLSLVVPVYLAKQSGQVSRNGTSLRSCSASLAQLVLRSPRGALCQRSCLPLRIKRSKL